MNRPLARPHPHGARFVPNTENGMVAGRFIHKEYMVRSPGTSERHNVSSLRSVSPLSGWNAVELVGPAGVYEWKWELQFRV